MRRDHDHALQLVEAMQAAGIQPSEDITAKLLDHLGEVIRFGCEGERRSKRNGYAVLFLDGRPAGCFGNWATQIKGSWKADGGGLFSIGHLDVCKRRIAKDEVRRLGLRKVADTAQCMLERARPASPSHPYLVRKGLPPIGLYQCDNVLMAPMTDIFGKLWNLQRIYVDGFKAYLAGPRKDCIFWSAGLAFEGARATHPERIFVGEGVATMLAVHVAKHEPVVAAMDTGGLEPAARALRACFPKTMIVICADDDAKTAARIGKNPGMNAAETAASAVGGWIATPHMRTL
jgi:putative DNA primase/helicase